MGDERAHHGGDIASAADADHNLHDQGKHDGDDRRERERISGDLNFLVTGQPSQIRAQAAGVLDENDEKWQGARGIGVLPVE